jgi:hypothetical protein
MPMFEATPYNFTNGLHQQLENCCLRVPLSGFVATVTLEIWALWPTRMAE